MKSESLHRIVAWFYASCFENVNTFLRCFRIEIPAGTQFLDGAHHTVTFHTAKFAFFNGNAIFRQRTAVMASGYPSTYADNRNQIAFMDIRRTGNNLNIFFLTHIDLADDQFICIRVFFNLFNLTDNNLVQILVHFHKSLNLCTG